MPPIAYNFLHDPHLKEYLNSPLVKKRLHEKGTIGSHISSNLLRKFTKAISYNFYLKWKLMSAFETFYVFLCFMIIFAKLNP